MNISIPILVTEQKQADQSSPLVSVRPLFTLQPFEQGTSMQRALNKLSKTLREKIEEFGKHARHDAVAALAFSPYLTAKTLAFRIFLASQSFDCKYLFVTFEAFGKRVAYTPNVPQIWFELERGEDLRRRAEDVLTEHFRQLERRDGKGTLNPAGLSFGSKAFVTSFELSLNLPQKFEKPQFSLSAMLGGDSKMDGAEELRKVGRCLDWLYPDDLERSTGRETELAELRRLLEHRDKRPVVMIGKKQVGKTALVNEYVFRQVEHKNNRNLDKKLTWLISPQRLISGMSYVGQWENRLIAILRETAEKEHLLYFDDLLGLFLAGISSSASLSVAQVLKPYIERRDVRVLAEITPETWRILQERDRSFAELFHVFRLEETTADRTLEILLSVRRNLEARFVCEFSLEALPTALDLQRRYHREAFFPGKAAAFLQQLGNKFQNTKITRQNVLEEFEAKSGMQVAFLDDTQKLERDEIVKNIAEGVIGQIGAVEAAADVISIAKSRLNDPGRPLASFLFLGPTGVGKTEAAKQIAAYLYGSDEKLLRFDMNEFVSPYDVARLTGTFEQPEGLLTAAIRRQPFSVVLLDEIEKADSDVFNLLLQVMGDGRLTDAHGRTADFSNAIIILTSNLGAREAGLKPGFRETNETNASVYRQAAEKFFRPEFFNRLDRIIPFERLSRDDVERIARLQLQKVFAREGFSRRNCRIELEPSALQKIVDEGYHPELGARALKRAIERNLVAPVAARLSALKTTAPTIIKVSRVENRYLTEVETISPVAITDSVWLKHDFTGIDRELDNVVAALDRLEDSIEHLKPRGEIDPEDEAQKRYFLVREHIKRVERMIERADNWNESKVRSPQSGVRRRQLVSLRDAGIDFEDFLGDSNLSFRLKESAEESPLFGEKVTDYVQDIWREVSLLQTITTNLEKSFRAATVMAFRCADRAFTTAMMPEIIGNYRQLLGQELGLTAADFESDDIVTDHFAMFLTLNGLFARDLARVEAGNHVFVSKRGDFIPIEIEVFALTDGQTFADFPELYRQSPENKTNKDFSVVRVYNERGLALDFRTALLTKERLTVRELRTFVLGGLKTAAELGAD